MRFATAVTVGLCLVVAIASSACTKIKAKDGAELETCYTNDKEGEQRPSILDRSPYNFELSVLALVFAWLLPVFGGPHAVGVTQDMEGTYYSTGSFNIWHSSAVDGATTMDWIASQPWSNGNVSTFGASADGLAAMMDWTAPSEHLSSQFYVFCGSSGFPVVYPGGAFRQGLLEGWLAGTVPKQAAALDVLIKANEVPGPYWDAIDATKHYANIKERTFFYAGWNDIFLNINLDAFNGAQYHAAPGHTGQAKIVVGPCGHCQHAAKYNPRHTIKGRAALPLLLGLETLAGTPVDAEGVKAVTFYVMGAYTPSTAPGGFWTTMDHFPESTPVEYYLAPGKALAAGSAPSSASSLSYEYDPANPLPTIGGNNLELPCGPADLSQQIASRPDVISFSTEPLEAPLYLTGGLTATLYVESNATDTDFTVFLADTYPNGTETLSLADGIIRMRWRDMQKARETGVPQAMESGTVYEVEVSLWNTSYVFAEGHSITVLVSSSNAPRFSANRNVAARINDTSVTPVVALNTVHFGGRYPSRITLPKVSPDDLPPMGVLEEELRKNPRYAAVMDHPKFDEAVAAFDDEIKWRTAPFSLRQQKRH